VNTASVYEGQKANSGSTTMLKTLSLFMAWVVFVNSAYAAKMSAFEPADASQASAPRTPTLKEQVVQIPVGSVIEVRLLSKEKLKGQLAAISDEGIVLKHTEAAQIQDRKIAFSEMKSVKTGGGKAGGIVLAVLATAGIVFVVIMVWALIATRGD
jgi:hypothetical protein